MNISDIQSLYDYNYWANARILDAAARVPAELFATASLGYCKLNTTLEHIMGAESIWLMRWTGVDPKSIDSPEDFPSVDALRAEWSSEQQKMRAYLATLSDEAVHQTITFKGADGSSISRTLWHVLVHVVNHGSQHRAELAMLLTELGQSPGDLDFSLFVRETGLR